MAAAVDLQTAIGQIAGEEGILEIPEGSWTVKTSSDTLELSEPIRNVTSYIDSDDLPILANGEISNEKGTAKYEQYLYFDDVTSSSVSYQEDDDENIGLFFKINDGEVIARYVMDFTTNLESDVTSANVLEDIEDEEITFLGKTYVITSATNSSTSVTDLTLMSGANKVTIANGEELTVGGKTVSVLVSATDAAQFTIDGETTSKLSEGETAKLADGTYLGVSEITYQNFAGGLMQATIYLGADKIELKDGNSMIVNAETINNAVVTISESHSGGDISISEISINMTAEDDLYVPINGKLSQAEDLDEPEVLVSENWDIAFTGLVDTEYEELSISKSTDSKIKLNFLNYNGDSISLPLVYANASGIFGGEKTGYNLVLNATNEITRNDYFILNTADPTDQAADARSFIVQYKGADAITDTNPKVKFDILGVDNDKEVTLDTTDGTADLKLGGTTFTFMNTSNAASDNFNINLTTGGYASGSADGVLSNYIRTQHNALINITDTNASTVWDENNTAGTSSTWTVTLSIDDTDRDGDQYTVSTADEIFTATFANNSDNEITATYSGGDYSSWITDPDDNTRATWIDTYGNEIEYSNPSGSPAIITVKIPESIVEPIVQISSGSIVGAGATTTGGLAPIIADSEISSYENKNLIVVGGSCINKVAAKLLGSDSPLCGADFTAKTNVGAGSYIIDTFISPYNPDKVAMLVAGYEAADTTAAAQRVVDDNLSPEVSEAAIIGPITA